MIWGFVGVLVLLAVIGLFSGAWWRRLGFAIAGILAAAAAVSVAAFHVTRPAETLPIDPNPSAKFRIAALGDSYIAGEGARTFFPYTDEPRRNGCHRAATAYPYLVAQKMTASLMFIACSGARTWHVTGQDASGAAVPGQFPQSSQTVIGRRPQIEVLRAAPRPDAVLLSIGGNDAGFAEIGRACVTPTAADCRRSASYWIDRLDRLVYPALVRTYTAVREAAHGAPVFAMTYPNPIGPEYCPDVGLTRAEMGFLRDVFVGRLNTLVSFAAAAAQVHVIDLADTLKGHRFCEQPLSRTAVNFVQLGRTKGSTVDISVRSLGGLGHGTFHPNARGHELMALPVLEQLRAVQADVRDPLPDAPPPGIPPPPFVPDEIGPPVGPHPFPKGTRCSGTTVAFVRSLAVRQGVTAVALAGVRPRSTVCHRTYQDAWHMVRADAEGKARVPVDVGRAGVASINEVLAEQPGGVWKKIAVSRLSAAGEIAPAEPPSNLGLYVVIALLAVGGCVALGLRWSSLRRHSPGA